MTDLDLTAAIEAAAETVWDHEHGHGHGEGHWRDIGCFTEEGEHSKQVVELAIEAALPEIRKALAGQVQADPNAQEAIDLANNTLKIPELANLITVMRDRYASIVSGEG